MEALTHGLILSSAEHLDKRYHNQLCDALCLGMQIPAQNNTFLLNVLLELIFSHPAGCPHKSEPESSKHYSNLNNNKIEEHLLLSKYPDPEWYETNGVFPLGQDGLVWYGSLFAALYIMVLQYRLWLYVLYLHNCFPKSAPEMFRIHSKMHIVFCFILLCVFLV